MEKESIGKKIVVTCLVVLLLVFLVGSGYLLGSIFGFTGRNPSHTNVDSKYEILDEVIYHLRDGFYYGEDSQAYEDKLIDNAVDYMVDGQGDPYTDYMSPEELEQFTSSLSSNFVGIGVTYQRLEGNVLVIKVLPDSPAEKAGVQEGDLIIKVDGVNCKDVIDDDELMNMVRGEIGTKVTVTIIRDNKEFEITIERGVVSNSVYSEVYENGIGYLQITSFADGTGKEVGSHLDRLDKSNIQYLIIDLRDDTGGYLSTLQQICSYFMDKNTTFMHVIYRDGAEEAIQTVKATKHEYKKIIILTNEYSASCSEVFICAMVENCGAITVGTTTYGKGVAQITYYLSNGGAIKYTDCIWESPSGRVLAGNGIVPDYEVYLHDALYQSYVTLSEKEVVKYDSVDRRISTVQMMLDFLGYKVNRQDGYFDLSTSNALKQFQQSIGLEATGNLDYATANALNSKVVSEWNLNIDKYDTQLAKAKELCH